MKGDILLSDCLLLIAYPFVNDFLLVRRLGNCELLATILFILFLLG